MPSTERAAPPLDRTAEVVRYDIANTGREALAKLSNRFYWDLVNATTADRAAEAGGALLQLMRDADALLCTSSGLSPGGWIDQARAWGGTAKGGNSAAWYEFAARSQPTVWTPQKEGSTTLTGLHDYANKQWGGWVGGFYRRRTKCYVDQAVADLAAKREVNATEYIACVAQWSYNWTHDSLEAGPQYKLCAHDGQPTGDVVTVSERLLNKYGALLGL